MRNYLLKSSEALPKSQGGVFAKKNTIRATLHPTLYTLPRATRYAATVLLLLCLGVGNAWGTASTSSDGQYASGTINFSTIGSLSAATTYWHNGVKFYSGNSANVSANTSSWSEQISIPAYISNKTASNQANKGKWGKNGTGKQYTMSGFACSQHTIGIHVNQACTLTVVVNKNRQSDTDDAAITASIDATAYGTAWTSSTYKTAGSTALTVTSSRGDATNKPGRYTLTIVVTAGNLTNGEAVVKMFNGSSGTGADKLFCWESITVTPAASCTAPNHVDISGAWDRFGGETISLTATAYSSAGTGSPIADANITGWQWQKYYNSTWNNVSNGTSDGVTISGATTKNLQISNCSYNNSGSYRCVVSTGATCSTASDGRQVKVYVLECYNGGTTVYNFTRTGSSQAGTLTIDLSASTAYTFKVHADNEYFGNNGTVNEDVTNWVMCNSGDAVCSTNLTVNSGLGGTFTFGIDYSTGGSSNVEGEPEISVTYPRKRIYLSPGVWDADDAKFAYYYFRTSGGSGWTDFLTEDDCGMYADIPQWNGVKINAVRLNKTTESTGSWGDKWNQTSDITITSNDYVEITGWGSGDSPYDYDSDYSTPTYTISYNTGSTTYTGGNSISGSKSNQTKTCGVDFTLPSSAIFTTTGYTQDGWATSDGGSKDYNLGGSYTTNAAATFYPHWSINTYTLTASATVINAMTEDSKTGAITGSFTNNPISSVPYGTSTSTSSNTFTANGTTVTAAATIAGTEAQCDECTYRFDSWENIPATVTADVNTIHAKYNTTYSITYNKDGGSWAGGYSAPAYYVYGTGATLPTGSNITKEHYSFDGWTLSGSTPDLVNGWGNVTLDANWTPNTYNVDFSFSNASRSSGDEEGTDAATYGEDFEVVVAASSGYALPATITVTIGGKTATSGTAYTWNQGTGTVTIDGDYITGDIVITITSVQTYTVTYNLNGGKYNGSSDAPTQAAVTSGTSITLPSLTPTKSGYVFASWKCSVDNTYHWESYSYTMTAANTTFTAQWVAAADLTSGTLYMVDDIKPLSVNAALSSTGQYAKGISSNGCFTSIGNPLRTDNSDGTFEFKTNDKQTVDAIDFTKNMWFKGASNVTSLVPTSRGLKFSVANPGTLTVYCERGDRINLSNGTTSAALTSNTSTGIIKREVEIAAAGTYYLYATGGSTRLAGIKFVEETCDDPSASLDNGAYTIGGSALDLRTLWSSSNTTNGVTFSVTNANGTGATIAGDGYSFSATTAGTATISASQTSTGDYCDAAETATITVSNPTYTVTYATTGSTGGSAPSDASSPYESGSTVTVLGNTGSLVKTGNVFLGWSDGNSNNYAPGETFTISTNTTLSPIWKEGTSATVTYTMAVGSGNTWSASGSSNETTGIPNAGVTITTTNAGIDSGKGAGSSRTAKLAIKTGANGATYDSPTNYILYNFSVASGYAFTPSDITIQIANVGSSSANNIKYKAVLSDASSHSISTTYICTTDNGTVETFHLYNKEGVTFDGSVSLKLWAWTIADKSDGGSAYRLGTPLTIAGVTESTATLYDIETSTTNGTIAVTVGGESASSAEEDATVTITATPSTGYSFSSWTVTKDAGGDVDVTSSTTNPTTFSMPGEAVTVSATFTPNTYDITYHLNGASWASAAGVASYTVGTGATLPLAGAMTNVGYTFDGWYANSGLTGDAVTSISTSDYGDKEYWAKWTENTYTVSYNKNGGSGDAMSNTVGHYVTLSDNAYTAPSGKIFVCWNTKSDGTGDDYSAGEEVELTANLPLYAKWATDYTITWDASAKLSGVAATPNLGGGNYTIRASVADWTGSLTSSMISTETSGVTITSVAVDNSSSPKTITATFNVGASVDDDAITFTLNVPAAGVYPAKESSTDIDIERCEGASGGGTTIFKARMKTSGLNDKNAELKALSSDANCTTDNYLSELEGGTLTLHLTSDKQAQAPNDSTIRLNENPAYWVIALSGGKSLQAGDIIKVRIYQNDAYLQKTSGDYSASTDLVLTKGTSTVNTYVVPNGMVGASTIYLKRISGKNTDLAYIEIYRPTETLVYFHVKDGLTNGNMPTDETQQTTSNNMAAVSGGTVYAGATTSGHLKIVNTNEIQLNNNTGYIKLVLPKNLAEGDILYFNSSHNYQVAITASASCSYTNHTAKKVYAIPASATDLIGKSTIYLWYHGSAANVKTLTVVRPGDGSGSSTIEPTLTWAAALESDPTWNSVEKTIDRNEGDPDFTISASTTTNTLGTITYSSDDESAATVNASGRVHIVGAGTPTITATLAASGCYEEKSITYTINIYAPACEDPFPTITTKDLGCDGVELSVPSGSSSYQWYQDGVSMGGSYVAAKCTVTVAGEYYVEVTNTCARASNTVTIAAKESVSATKIVNSWYVKNGRRTPDIALVQTENATGFYVKIGDDKIWDEANSVTTGFGGCGFYLGEDGIIYLKGQKNDGTAPSGLDADETLKITATGCGGDADELSIDIKWQAATTRPSVAFVSLGTEKGAFTDTTANYYKTTPLYKYLDYTLGGGAFDLTAQNIYSTVDEQALREHYSQFDAILITDDPNTGKKKDGKSYVDAMGALIDIRPMLTMEAFVSKLANWKAKGINGNPSSPNPRQYGMKLECKDHEIFADLNSASSNVDIKTIDGIDYWTVLMVDSTKSPYSGVAYNASTSDKPALQGFSASDVSGLLLLGEISAGTLYAGVERQDEPAARLMLLGLNNKALPNALTDEGKKVIANALKYLLKTNMEDVDDCSNYFTGAAGTTNWNTAENWSKSAVPNSPTTKVRILKPCVVSGGTFQVASVDIATSGKSGKGDGVANCTGSLTINADGALIVGGKVRTAVAPNFNSADLMPTTVNDLVINTSSTAQACLIMNNDAGDTKATVNLYSLGRNDGSYQFQYMAIPMSYVPVNPSFAGAGIYTYVWQESSNGWERRGYYTDLYAFEGVGITTTAATASNYQMKGSLAPTTTKEIALTRDNKGLNLVGNSWTAPIQISKLSEDNTDDNIEKVVYIYSTGYDAEGGALSGGTETAGQWLAIPFNAAGFEAWGGLKVIPSMQAFQVKVKEGGATLTLDYDKVVRGDNQALNAYLRAPKRTTEPSDIVLTRLRVADTKTHTDLYLFEGEQFSDAYDNGWEANFRAGDGRSAMLYARTAAGVMAVAALPELEGTQVFFIPGKETEYTFTFTGGDDTYYLNDIKEQKSTLINEANSYTFRYESGDAANRFIISRTPFEAPSVTTGITDLDAETPKAIKVIYNDKLYIIRGGRVYSADGSLVK